jgi:S1-C subfamily serine protease
MSVVEELRNVVADAAEKVGPSVVGLGRGWGRGSGVVTGPGVVITNAHVLRGEEVAVTFADGRTELGRVAGADADLDLAAIAVDTGDAPAVTWDPERPWPARDVRAGQRDRPLVPRPARAPDRRLVRAHRAAAAGLVGRAARRR